MDLSLYPNLSHEHEKITKCSMNEMQQHEQ